MYVKVTPSASLDSSALEADSDGREVMRTTMTGTVIKGLCRRMPLLALMALVTTGFLALLSSRAHVLPLAATSPSKAEGATRSIGSQKASPADVILYGESFPQCSAEDFGYLKQLQKGDPQPFFLSLAECSRQSVTWKLTFDVGGVVSCMRERKYHKHLSEACLKCYGMNGQFAFDKCKWPCLGSWCSSSCLNCTAQNDRAFSACSGRPRNQMPYARTC